MSAGVPTGSGRPATAGCGPRAVSRRPLRHRSARSARSARGGCSGGGSLAGGTRDWTSRNRRGGWGLLASRCRHRPAADRPALFQPRSGDRSLFRTRSSVFRPRTPGKVHPDPRLTAPGPGLLGPPGWGAPQPREGCSSAPGMDVLLIGGWGHAPRRRERSRSSVPVAGWGGGGNASALRTSGWARSRPPGQGCRPPGMQCGRRPPPSRRSTCRGGA